MAGVTVYGIDGCDDCYHTTQFLRWAGVEYTWVDLMVDDAARERLRHHHLPLPIVETPHARWGGYRHERLAALADEAKKAKIGG